MKLHSWEQDFRSFNKCTECGARSSSRSPWYADFVCGEEYVRVSQDCDEAKKQIAVLKFANRQLT